MTLQLKSCVFFMLYNSHHMEVNHSIDDIAVNYEEISG